MKNIVKGLLAATYACLFVLICVRIHAFLDQHDAEAFLQHFGVSRPETPAEREVVKEPVFAELGILDMRLGWKEDEVSHLERKIAAARASGRAAGADYEALKRERGVAEAERRVMEDDLAAACSSALDALGIKRNADYPLPCLRWARKESE